MLDLSVIVLTYNEQIHLHRCLSCIKSLARQIFVLDSYSNDSTSEIASLFGANVIKREWPGNQALQFNWALQNLPIKTKWVLRLDADEYLLPELIDEIKLKLDTLPENITGVVFKRRHIFLGKWVKRGTYPVKLLRLFKYKKAVCEQRWMDEHIVLLEGESVEFENDLVDHNLNNLSWWTEKHNGYAIREAVDLLDIELNLLGNNNNNIKLSAQSGEKRKKKFKYARQPLFLRSFFYFLYRYILKGGFLEGKEGFLWHFLQGWWYRTLVDAKILEIKRHCGSDKEKIKAYLSTEYNIQL